MLITRRMQVQAVAALLDGRETHLNVEQFDDPWWGAYRALAEMGQDRSMRVQRLSRALSADHELLTEILEHTDECYISLQELAAHLSPIEWLWPNWIPRGMITLLGAVPGAGKSYLALDLAQRLIEGKSFPDGSRVPVMENPHVLYVDAEMVPQLINTRAELWGMDRSRVYLLQPANEQLYIDFSDPGERDRLVDMAYHLNPALIIIDSLSSISSRGENNVEDVRTILGFLNMLAQDMQAGLLLIHHLRKRPALQMSFAMDADDFRGSSHIIAMSRSVMGLSVIQTGPEVDRNGPRRLEIVKTNLGPYPRSLGVEFVPHGDGITLRYGDVPTPFREPTKTDLCRDWLTDLLQNTDEPMKPKVIVALGKEEGFSRQLIYNQRKGMANIQDTEDSRHSPDNKWEWVREI